MIDILEFVEENGLTSYQRTEGCHLLKTMQSIEFIVNFHMINNILRISNDLSQELKRSDRDSVNVISLVRVCKERLQNIRYYG